MTYEYDRRSRTAGATPRLGQMKEKWSVLLLEAMEHRFKSYGGWRDYGVTSKIEPGHGTGVSLTLRSEAAGWAGNVYIDSSATLITASMTLDDTVSEDFLADLLKDDDLRVPISDNDDPDNMVMKVSLFFSKALNGRRPR